jgi:methylated-DNA-[protein]-cysteine S-methyltransferase
VHGGGGVKDLLLERVDSPLGEILVVSDGTALCALDYAGYEDRMHLLLHKRYGDVRLHGARDPNDTSSRLRAYFAGDFAVLETIVVDTGGTVFQQAVWSELRRVAAGKTVTYGELSLRLGRSLTSSRAVGLANSLNPVAIVVPCHRVIGADSRLTGYAGGLDRKRWLLHHESAQLTLADRTASARA